MVKALRFKGDKKAPKKRKRQEADPVVPSSSQTQLTVITEDENWVSAEGIDDIAGPVLLLLPTVPLSSMAVDQLGTVFASPIENVVDDEASTAEPHEVRQVWIGQKVVGTADRFTFKGHHGKYLGCDRFGMLSSTSEAVSSEETFICRPVEGAGPVGRFAIQTLRDTYLAVDRDKSPLELRGDADEQTDRTSFRIRLQARFKPRHQVEKAEMKRAKISRSELEGELGRRLNDEEVKTLKKARREGNYHEALLDVKVGGKHDKFA